MLRVSLVATRRTNARAFRRVASEEILQSTHS